MPPQRRHPGRLDLGRAPPQPASRIDSWNDEAILELSQRDSEAFALLVERHHDRFRRYLSRRVAPDQIDDALAEVWETGFRRRHTYDAARGSATGWLYGIAKNVTHHARRRAVRRRDLHGRLQTSHRHEPASDPADQLTTIEELGHLRSAVASLPAHEREVVELVLLSGASYASASEQLAVPIGTIRSRLARARTRLRSSTPNDVGF